MCFMGRKLLLGILGLVLVLSAFLQAAPSGADAEQDYELLTTLDAVGVEITDPALVLQQARMVCNEGLAHGVSWQEMRSQLMNWGYSLHDASLLIANAISTYCPEYTDITDEIIGDDQFRSSYG